VLSGESSIYIDILRLMGLGSLNLAAANRVFIVEPQWNPSVENQAVARALRLGQKQPVLVTRYVVDCSVEKVSGAPGKKLLC
jgi:hypothetical protein